MVGKRPKCVSCNRGLSPWGKTSSGKKRYGCNYCHITRRYQQNIQKVDIFQLFKQYVLWGNTYEMLSSLSKYSVRYLERKFHTFFLEDPPKLPLINQRELEESFLLLDGLWFTRRFVLMAYRQSRTLVLLHVSVMGNERGSRIAKDLRVIKETYSFTGIVSDGGTGIKNAVMDVFGHIPHQICLAHMHRDIIGSLGRYPKDPRVKDLKALADHVWFIESKEALEWWRKQVISWYKKNRDFVHEKRWDDQGNVWYIHKGVRHAFRVMVDLPQTSFKFLDHPLMPKTTNELEAQFGHLGKRWLAHRGMKQERWKDFLKWFVYFYNQEKLSQKNIKKD